MGSPFDLGNTAAADIVSVRVTTLPLGPMTRVGACCSGRRLRSLCVGSKPNTPCVASGAVRTDHVGDSFDRLRLLQTSEKAPEIFERYISDAIRRYPTLNAPTQLDFGPARIIVLDLQYVAPTGSAAANRQTEIMYLLARHILARNFFLHPEYLVHVPERVKDTTTSAFSRFTRRSRRRLR